MGRLKIAVIGAGLGGLAAAKYAKSSGHTVTIFEQCVVIGGTWVYSDVIGKDEHGLNVHTSMYQNLRTNLPKEIMGFRDYPFPQNVPRSYILSAEVLSYLISYAEHFELNQLIKFKHHVTRVHPIDGTKWEVTVVDLLANKPTTYVFDAIFVANGHNSVPFCPEIEGANNFQGHIMHSHDYRRADTFKDKIVLIIGGGPSGVDITYAISETAKTVIFSHHAHNAGHNYPANVVRKGSVMKFTPNGVVFVDGSENDITDVVICTGYTFTMPFITDECGLRIDNNYVIPLYKHCINAIHPTMAVIGYVFTSAITQMIDMQVRFVMQYLNGNAILPSREEMIADSDNELQKRLALGWPKKKGHSLGGAFQRQYFNDLATTANIDNIREVILRIYEDSSKRRGEEPKNYRKDLYKIVDDEHFERTSIE